MPEFLTLAPPAEALERLLTSLPQQEPQVEWISTEQALGRVTARRILAPEDLPAFARSSVDGYAVRARDTYGASDGLPAYLALAGEVPMGKAPGFMLGPGQAASIHTGGMLPGGADAVVMLEVCQPARPGEIEVLRPAAPGDNVVQAGEDILRGAEVLPAGTYLRAVEIGSLMALGITRLPLAVPPRVAILSSGDEVILPDRPVLPGQVRDVNSYTLSALVTQWGGLPLRLGIFPDTFEDLSRGVGQALAGSDLVVVTAGSSASVRDLTAAVVSAAGRPGVLVHGINVRPGKPTILAVCDGKAVVGLPGNPVSALVIAGLFVRPLVHRLLGLTAGPAPVTYARLTAALPSQAGREDYAPVRLVNAPGGMLAEPVFYKSNLILTLVRATGLARVPADATGISAGELVEVIPL